MSSYDFLERETGISVTLHVSLQSFGERKRNKGNT